MNNTRLERLKKIWANNDYLVLLDKNKLFNKKTGKTIGRLSSDGKYIGVSLQLNGKSYDYSLHEIVAFVYLGEDLINKEVNHRDGNRFNNFPYNLEMVTAKANHKHQTENDLLSKLPGHKNPNSILDQNSVCAILSSYKFFEGNKSDFCKRMSLKYGVSKDTIKDIVNRRRWKHIEAIH